MSAVSKIEVFLKDNEYSGSSIAAFLTPADRLTFKRSNKNLFQLFLPAWPPRWELKSFQAKFGEILPLESEANIDLLARQTLERQKVGKWTTEKEIPFAKEDHFVLRKLEFHFSQGFFLTRFVKKVRYYSGYEYAALMKNFALQTDQKLAQFDQLQDSPLPQPTIAAVRDRCIRALTIAKELDGLSLSAKKVPKQLASDTEKLPGLIRKTFQAVQFILFKWMQPAQHAQKIEAARDSMASAKSRSLADEVPGRLNDLRKGRNQARKDNELGFHLGETQSPIRNQKFGIYVLPESQFRGRVSIHLSQNGKRSLAEFTLFISQEDPSKKYLICREAFIQLDDRDPQTKDRFMMRSLSQLLIEIFIRAKVQRLEYAGSRDDAHVLVCCGFKSPLESHQQQLLKEIEQARAKNERFPECDYGGHFKLYLTSNNGSVLDEIIDFGDGPPTTWRDQIAAHPLLPPHEGAFFPGFWRVDPLF